MNIKKIIESNKGRHILFGILCFIFIVFSFRAGIELGYREAVYSSRFGDNYSRNFLGENSNFMGMMRGGIPGGNAASGKVVKIDPPVMLVATQNNFEKIVRFDDDTLVRRFRDSIKGTDIKVGDNVVVIGFPNDDGEIVAKLIRLVPTATSTQATTTPKI